MAPLSRALFCGLESSGPHLCCGSEAPLLRAAATAFDTYVKTRAAGQEGRERLEAAREEVRGRVAALMGVPTHSDRIAFTAGASAALDVIARTVSWSEGDEVLSFCEEYPSVILAWRALTSCGVSTRLIESGERPEERLLSAISERTRLVCISHVSWRTGVRLDIEYLSSVLRPRGILLVVDASHSLGVLPIRADLCDAVVSCGHKFLLGLHGTGILYWAGGKRPTESVAGLGWYAVQRFAVSDGVPDFVFKSDTTAFEAGNPPFLSLLVLQESLRCLDGIRISKVAEHALKLASALRRAVADRGIPCLTPLDVSRHGTSIAIPEPFGRELHDALRKAGILTSVGFGRVRISFHGYNTEGDLAQVVAVLDRMVKPR